MTKTIFKYDEIKLDTVLKKCYEISIVDQTVGELPERNVKERNNQGEIILKKVNKEKKGQERKAVYKYLQMRP